MPGQVVRIETQSLKKLCGTSRVIFAQFRMVRTSLLFGREISPFIFPDSTVPSIIEKKVTIQRLKNSIPAKKKKKKRKEVAAKVASFFFKEIILLNIRPFTKKTRRNKKNDKPPGRLSCFCTTVAGCDCRAVEEGHAVPSKPAVSSPPAASRGLEPHLYGCASLVVLSCQGEPRAICSSSTTRLADLVGSDCVILQPVDRQHKEEEEEKKGKIRRLRWFHIDILVQKEKR
ncbi:hypothetical protein DAPPUDRAFT_240035 [Daphnia pulex]|uniref:Uncharacterized protein n=1 Tax=Daphnia pulex TaxID=6669 RepID=E9GAQ4_DAPPU|nr:hypothetical protein DAPPUDRAFT_240035 [Daphnia pulex]|eukprot:EFX83296.1 hypothetical protein DAPPUDRAFT_240035 [Daphnia pulex]